MMLDNKMDIREANINDLVFPSYNPRKKLKPEDKEYQKIKQSIENFGYSDLVIINKDNTIISGNQRTQVMKDMGIDKIKVVQLDLDKNKEKALNVALNKITGEWDYELLSDLLVDLEDNDFDLGLTGFDDFEIESIISPIDWQNVEDLTEENYDKPVKDCLECPKCHHIDSSIHFKKIEGVEENNKNNIS